MHINDLLKLKLQEDLYDELMIHYNKSEFKNKKLYKKICLLKIKEKTNHISFFEKNKINIPDNKRCCSRIWDNHKGTRCYYLKKKNEDYCQHHLNMIQKNGKLIFNRYDEDKPIYNEKNNRIPWIEKSEIETLNDIIQKQWNIVNKIIKFNLKKQRQITP